VKAVAIGLLVWLGWLCLSLLPPPPPPTVALSGVAVAREAPPPPPPAPAPVTAPEAPPAPMPASGGQAELWPGAAPCAGWHAGAIDWCAAEGTPVAAPASGTLTSIGSYSDAMKYGAYVILTTAGGLEIYLGHLNHEDVAPGLNVGQWVEAGTVVGYLSEFAYSTPHTHVQLRRGGALVAPDVWWAAWEGR
jgi:murein DD-endopeptidase MepM/ murein hydrolase activator NlpD